MFAKMKTRTGASGLTDGLGVCTRAPKLLATIHDERINIWVTKAQDV